MAHNTATHKTSIRASFAVTVQTNTLRLTNSPPLLSPPPPPPLARLFFPLHSTQQTGPKPTEDPRPHPTDPPRPKPTDAPRPKPTFCKDLECPAGYHFIDGADYVECFADECDRDECCAKGEKRAKDNGMNQALQALQKRVSRRGGFRAQVLLCFWTAFHPRNERMLVSYMETRERCRESRSS